jgi:hypothetical protein
LTLAAKVLPPEVKNTKDALTRKTIVNKKKTLMLIIVSLFLSSLWPLMNFIDLIRKSSSNFDEQFFELAKAANEKFPKMIDPEIRCDSVIALPNKTLQYNLTLINYSKNELDIDEFKNQIYPKILNNIKTNPDMRILRKNKVTIIFLYKDKDDYEISKIVYNYDDYN